MLDTKTNAVTALAMDLMRKKSITPEDGGCQELLAKRLTALGFKCEHLRYEEVDNLWARFGTEAPLLVFAGHTDVVPTGPEADWKSPPFKPEIRDDYLFGRGASDMKTGIAAQIIAVEEFIQQQPHFKGSIAFLITSDEEGPALNGTVKVMEWLQKQKIKIDYCIIGEPSSDVRAGDQMRIGRRGSLHGRLMIHGKQGHVANPQHAINPIHQAALALHEIAATEWDKGNEAYPATTFQISNLHSGTGAANVIPGHMEVIFNFRFGTAVTVDQLKQRTEEILKKHKLKFDLTWIVAAEPFLTKKGKLIDAAVKSIEEITHQTPRLSTGGGTSDGRFIAPTGAELIELGPSNATAHHVDECIRLEDLNLLTEAYRGILSRLFR